jgi:hypothetical protein
VDCTNSLMMRSNCLRKIEAYLIVRKIWCRVVGIYQQFTGMWKSNTRWLVKTLTQLLDRTDLIKGAFEAAALLLISKLFDPWQVTGVD